MLSKTPPSVNPPLRVGLVGVARPELERVRGEGERERRRRAQQRRDVVEGRPRLRAGLPEQLVEQRRARIVERLCGIGLGRERRQLGRGARRAAHAEHELLGLQREVQLDAVEGIDGARAHARRGEADVDGARLRPRPGAVLPGVLDALDGAVDGRDRQQAVRAHAERRPERVAAHGEPRLPEEALARREDRLLARRDGRDERVDRARRRARPSPRPSAEPGPGRRCPGAARLGLEALREPPRLGERAQVVVESHPDSCPCSRRPRR